MHQVRKLFIGLLIVAFAAGVGMGTAVAQTDGSAGVKKAYQGPGGLSNSVTFGGYFEHEFEDKENSPSQFDQHRTILFFGAQPHERLKFFNELELEHGAGEIKLEQSWLEFSLNENHNFRGGVDLIPVGRRNVNHDGNLRDFVFRPYSSGKLIPTTWFESGLSFNGSLPGNLSYTVGVSNGMNAAAASDTGTRSEFESMVGMDLAETDNNNSKAVYGRLAVSPVLGTEIGLSGYNSTYQGDNSITYTVLDFNTIQGPLEFTGEYINIDKDQQASGGLEGASGGNIEAGYHFFPDFLRGSFIASGFDNPTFTALARYELLNYDTPGSTNLDESYTSVGFNYRPIEQMAFKFSYDMESRDADSATEEDRFGYGMVIGF